MKLPISTPAQSVYFVQDEHGYVKIGWTVNVAARLSGLQVGSPHSLFLIRVIDGGPATEAWLHRRFEAFRVRGEWFRFDEAMITVVPPDEIPVRAKVKRRRDVRLTIKEHLQSVDNDEFLALKAKEKIFLLSGQWTEEQCNEVLEIIRSHVGLSQAEAA